VQQPAEKISAGGILKFTQSPLSGVYVVEIEPVEDDRGFFARIRCGEEFSAHGLNSVFQQDSISFNRKQGTLRGMHYQAPPHAEAKLVRCTRGAVYDVAVDLRSDSSTFCRWFAVELTADNRKMLYVPTGCAHGFQTLEDSSELLYQISEVYRPDLARGVRWNDAAFQIRWPISSPILSPRDLSFPDLCERFEDVLAGRKRQR
jgi:dTDP-4-dehydrorhamnose 3,5-epimerase